jgi:glutathione peroxidase
MMKITLAALAIAAASDVSMAQSQGESPKPASNPPAPTAPAVTPTQPASTPAQPATGTAPDAAKDPAFILQYTVKDIDGKDVKLEDYKGKVLLIVNVASRCGYTSQYDGLEKLYQAKKDQGLVILGFPANNFMGQEPGTDEEIKKFCTTKYSVTFPMFSKVSVKGKDAHPLFAQMSALPKPKGGEPSWNFNKFLIGRDGKVVEHFASDATPSDKKLVGAIEAELKKTS